MQKADADSKSRCQHQTASGAQCEYVSIIGESYCTKHAMKNVGGYRLRHAFNRVNELSQNPTKGVAVEKAILQHQLETVMNTCETVADQLVNEHKITNLSLQIAKLSLIDHKLSVATGRMLDVNTLVVLLDNIQSIIALHVTDKDIQAKIAQGIGHAIEQATVDAAQKASDKIGEEQS